MKKQILILLSLLLGIHSSVFASGDFDRLKTLVGQWEATGPEGTQRATFRLISNGTALMETMRPGGEDMVTIYHPDGDSTLLTHYCSGNNQPRMRARNSGGADSITFHFVDASNLKGSEAGHIHRLVITFQDADHVIEEWTWRENGQERTSVFHLRRIK